MQKRLLALVATVAMVLSMFAGVAFAENSLGYELDLTYEVTYNEVDDNFDLAITAKIFDDEGNRLSTADLEAGTVSLVDSIDADVLDQETVFNNTIYVTANDLAKGTYSFKWAYELIELEEDIVIAEDEGGDDEGDDTVPNKYGIQLGVKKFISSGSTPGFQQVVGTISRTAGNVTPVIENFKVAYSYKVLDSEGNLTDVSPAPAKVGATNGQFSFYLPTNIPAQDITLTVYVNDADKLANPTAEGGTEDLTAKIEVRYNLTTNPDDLKFSFTNQDEPVIISGKVTDRNGNPVKGRPVVLEGYSPDGLKTSDTGEFAFVVYKWTAAVEKLPIQIDGAGHKDVTVGHKEAKLTVSPSSGVVHTIVDTEFTVNFSGFGEALESLKVMKGDDEVFVVDPGDLPTLTEGAFKNFKFTWTPGAAGTYTLVAKAGNYSASATIVVDNPLGYNFVGTENVEELEVGTNSIKVGPAGDIYLVTWDGKIANTTFYYDVLVDGKEVLTKSLDGTFEVKAPKLGTKSIKVVAYKQNSDGSYTAVHSQTFTAKVNGWDVTMEPSTVTVNEAQDITFVIKDANGAPVNNATIIVGSYKLSPANYNAANGTYVIEDAKFTKADKYPVSIKLLTKVEVVGGELQETYADKANLELTVVGQRVYTVTSDVDALLQGKAQTVKFTITKDGVAVIPHKVSLVYADGESDTFTPSYLGDGVTQVGLTAAKAGAAVVRVENFDGTLCGEVEIDVVAPKLVLIDEEAANLTENFNTKVNFKVVDPRDDSVIKTAVELDPSYVEIAVKDANDGLLVNNTLLGAEEHTITVLATKADYDGAEDEEEVVAVYLNVYGVEVDGHFEVMPATITSDPEMIVIGANNNLTLTFADANGKAIEGKEIKAGGAKLGKTDENGQVIYPVSVATAAVTITGATDVKDVVVEKSIKIGYDAEAPQVNWELDGNKATIVISDNVRLVRINIDGEEIDFWPGAKYEFVRTLQPGVNKFNIKAQDSNDNVFNEVVEIEYVTDAVVLEGELVHRQGDFTFVQARQFEELGAKFDWDNASKTATFTIGETTVEVTIGSTTAKVNGEAVTMPAAPYIDNNRTYVPIRFISENLGWNVDWAVGDIITISL